MPDSRDGQMIHADGVIESGVRRPGIDEVGEAELPDVAEPLESLRIHDAHSRRIESNRIPQRVPNDPFPALGKHGGC